MKKICINDDFGGFGLSDKAVDRYAELKGLKLFKEDGLVFGSRYYFVEPDEYHRLHKECEKKGSYEEIRGLYFCDTHIERDDPVLIQVVEELGKEADGFCASLKIVEIPDDIEWTISDYDGAEWVAEEHRTWS